MKRLFFLSVFCVVGISARAVAQAEFTVTTEILRPAEKMPPIGANDWGKIGSVEWAANNFVQNSGNEFPWWKRLHRVSEVFEDGSFDIETGTSWYSLYGDGFLSGAAVRIYRLVDKEGNPLPLGSSYIDVSQADRAVLVGETTILPEGSPGLPCGGWAVQKYTAVTPFNGMAPGTTTCTDTAGIENGCEYWYRLIAIGSDARTESDPTNEVSATPTVGKEKLSSSHEKNFEINPVKGGKASEDLKPDAPKNLKAVAGDGCVTLTWEESPSADIKGYKLLRSRVPGDKQVNRIYLDKSAPKIEPWDYIVVTKKFAPFDMKVVSSRVRGVGTHIDRPNFYWTSVTGKPILAQVAHSANLPTEMENAGEACMEIVADEGKNTIGQFVFTGTNAQDAFWYGQLEPDKHYVADVWLRQEGLAENGRVRFYYTAGYPGIETTWDVTDKWKKFTYEFDGPERPGGKTIVFAHALDFMGPGKLYVDNFQIRRMDNPADSDKPYIPGTITLDELLRSQPSEGRKGVHRIWFLRRDATMDSILSWKSNSQVRPDWNTSLRETMRMTLPMGLEFDRLTGDKPETRMRPWLVLQHILHSEQDWKNFIEYLAAPYDPAKDSPETKPYAARRVNHRGGVTTPWTDEFSEFTIEFGNETWHNGAMEDWIGFSGQSKIWQGGPEYGYFSQYLINNIKSSPYWASEKLAAKIKFNVGGGYNVKFDGDKVTGYGEEAIQTAPDVASVGHANYVGPKWETKDAAFKALDDEGWQATLLGFVAGPDLKQRDIAAAQPMIERTHNHKYEIVAYEGGPSGYPLGSKDKEQLKISEFYGKSQAMAVAALDAWMSSYALGWTDQAFLGFGQGKMWNSHAPIYLGFYPHPGWLALSLRNQFASGDLIKVEENEVPQITWSGKDYPGIAVFAMRDANRLSVFVLSRFLDETTSVKLRLPIKAAKKIGFHYLNGTPRDHNLDEAKVQIKSDELPATALKDGLFQIDAVQPGAVSVYTFEM